MQDQGGMVTCGYKWVFVIFDLFIIKVPSLVVSLVGVVKRIMTRNLVGNSWALFRTIGWGIVPSGNIVVPKNLFVHHARQRMAWLLVTKWNKSVFVFSNLYNLTFFNHYCLH